MPAARHIPPRVAPFRSLCTTLLIAATITAPVRAQSGVVTFGGVTNQNGALPTASYSGPALTFTSAVRAGFGNTAVVQQTAALWWTSDYSGQGMVYGNNSSSGNVLEIALDAGAGFNLNLTSALFGAWVNRAANVTYRLYNADYSLSTAAVTVLTGTTTPATATFATNGWGSIIRLQFTETTAGGVPSGRGAFDVGVQGIGYTRTPATNQNVVPEPSTYVLMLSGLGILGLFARRRAAA